MTTPKAVRYLPVMITNSLAVTLVVKLLPETMRAGFHPNPICVAIFVLKLTAERIYLREL
jgi:hypothetical protein